MRVKNIQKGGTFINVLSLIIVFVVALSAFLYFPIAKDKMNLEALIGEFTLQSHRTKKDEFITTFVREAKRQYGLTVYEEDVEVYSQEKVFVMDVIWRPVIVIPIIGYEFELSKRIVKERVIL